MYVSGGGENWIGREERKKKQKKRGRERTKKDRKGSLDFELGKRTKSSPDLLEEEEKCPCFLGDYFRAEGGPVVFLFKLGEKRKHQDSGMKVIAPSKSRWHPEGSMSVVLGSVVYIFGGLFEDPEVEGRYILSDKVFYFDTNNLRSEEQGWVRGPDMLNGRFDGKCVTVEGRIYVFGGIDPNDDSNRRPWAEVLDPAGNNKWEPLSPPASPDRCYYHNKSLLSVPVVTYGGTCEAKTILLKCCRSIYHVNSKTWEEFPCSQDSVRFTANLTAVGNLLYWTSMGILHTFDTKTEELRSAAIEGFNISKHQKDFLDPEPALFHLGRESFCLITLKELDPDLLSGGRTKVHCSKFRVSGTGGGFKASIVCHQAYIVDHPLGISGAFVLNVNRMRCAVHVEGDQVSNQRVTRSAFRKLQQEKEKLQKLQKNPVEVSGNPNPRYVRNFTKEENEAYGKKIRESEGFDVGELPQELKLNNVIKQISLERSKFSVDYCIRASNQALRVYNKRYHVNYEFVKLIRVNMRFVTGIQYYITFLAKDGMTIDERAGSLCNFQALVRLFMERIYIKFCRKERKSALTKGPGETSGQ